MAGSTCFIELWGTCCEDGEHNAAVTCGPKSVKLKMPRDNPSGLVLPIRQIPVASSITRMTSLGSDREAGAFERQYYPSRYDDKANRVERRPSLSSSPAISLFRRRRKFWEKRRMLVPMAVVAVVAIVAWFVPLVFDLQTMMFWPSACRPRCLLRTTLRGTVPDGKP
jgi:hypothetical protein